MRLIDADALAYEILSEYGADGGTKDVNTIYGMVINAPTIDAEPVVRCIDCMYFKKCITDFTGDTVELNACSYNNHGTNEDGYCSYGEEADTKGESR